MNENFNDVTYKENNTATSKYFKCPVCLKEFDDIHSFAAHMTEHSETAKKQKAEEERKAREDERKKDVENLELLYAEKVAATKKLDKATEEYKKKYGGLTFPYYKHTNDLFDMLLNDLFN